MTMGAIFFMTVVHCTIYTGIFVAMRKILKNEANK